MKQGFLKPMLWLLAVASLAGGVLPVASWQGPGWLPVAAAQLGPSLGGFGDGEPAQASAMRGSAERVAVSVEPARSRVTPGGDVVVAVVLDHEDEWHTHTHDPQVPPALGDASFYIATAIAAEASPAEALTPHIGAIQWPEPKTIEVAFTGEPVQYDVLGGKAVAYLPVTVAADAPLGEATLEVRVTYQACDDRVCLAPVYDEPHEVTFEVVSAEALAEAGLTEDAGDPAAVGGEVFADFDPGVWQRIRAGEVGPAPATVAFSVFQWQFELNIATGIGLALLLLAAALGGLLLNLTPCVLPIIPIKIMGLSKMAGSRGRCLALGAVMSAGVVAFWLALGGAIALTAYLVGRGLVAEGGGFGTGYALFQYPAFTIGAGVVIIAMAVGMCGLFTVQLPRFIYAVNPRQDTYHGSFGFGVMTAILSTPCTAPLMGAAAAGAVTQRPGVALAVFAAIGGGMALPYLVLAAFPKLVERMPRTGPASELIKQVMGLLMLAAGTFFVGTGLTGVWPEHSGAIQIAYWWAIGLLVLAAGLWLAWRTIRIAPARGPLAAALTVAAALAVVGPTTSFALTRPDPIPWVAYSPERFEQVLAEDRVVMLEFTATWCLNCKALEEAVLRDARVVEVLNRDEVVPMKVDLTGNNPVGNQKLLSVGRVMIPALVVFAPDGSETFNGDFYTVEQVIGAIEQAGERRNEAVATRSAR